MQRGLQRQWNDRAEHPRNSKRKKCTDTTADSAADQCHHQDLRQVDLEDAAATGPKSLHLRDRVSPPVEVTFDPVTDADTADQQCSQSDDCKKLRKALDVAF